MSLERLINFFSIKKYFNVSEYLEHRRRIYANIAVVAFFSILIFFVICIYTYSENFEYPTERISQIDNSFKYERDNYVKRKLDTIPLINHYNELYENELDNMFKGKRRIGFLFIISPFLSFILSWLIYKRLVNSLFFHCFHCYKAIYVKSIKNLTCPVCNKKSKSIFTLLNYCSCKTKLKYLECPHCHEDIDLFKNYDESEIKQKIYNA